MTVEEKIKGDLLETAAAAAIRRNAQPLRAARNLAETAAFLAQGLKAKPEKTEELARRLEPFLQNRDLQASVRLLRQAVMKGEEEPRE